MSELVNNILDVITFYFRYILIYQLLIGSIFGIIIGKVITKADEKIKKTGRDYYESGEPIVDDVGRDFHHESESI